MPDNTDLRIRAMELAIDVCRINCGNVFETAKEMEKYLMGDVNPYTDPVATHAALSEILLKCPPLNIGIDAVNRKSECDAYAHLLMVSFDIHSRR